MPDPYLLARRNRLEWLAEYLDQELCPEEDVITFNNQEGPLVLASAPYLGPGEEVTIALRRRDKVSLMFVEYSKRSYLFFSQLLLLKIFQRIILRMKNWN